MWVLGNSEENEDFINSRCSITSPLMAVISLTVIIKICVFFNKVAIHTFINTCVFKLPSFIYGLSVPSERLTH